MSIDRLQRAIERLHDDPVLHEWLREGQMALAEGKDLAAALELRGSMAIRHRDRELSRIANELAPGASISRQARVLAYTIRRAIRDRARSDTSARIRALAAYGHVPQSRRRIFSILQNQKYIAQKTNLN